MILSLHVYLTYEKIVTSALLTLMRRISLLSRGSLFPLHRFDRDLKKVKSNSHYPEAWLSGVEERETKAKIAWPGFAMRPRILSLRESGGGETVKYASCARSFRFGLLWEKKNSSLRKFGGRFHNVPHSHWSHKNRDLRALGPFRRFLKKGGLQKNIDRLQIFRSL